MDIERYIARVDRILLEFEEVRGDLRDYEAALQGERRAAEYVLDEIAAIEESLGEKATQLANALDAMYDLQAGLMADYEAAGVYGTEGEYESGTIVDLTPLEDI